MQSGILEWIRRLYDQALPGDIDARKVLGIPRDVPEDFPSEAVALGLWNVIPLGEGGIPRYRHSYAVRLAGGASIESNSLVIVTFNTMLTVAGSLATAVPMSVFRKRLFDNPEGWQVVYEQWDRIEPALIRLHRFLGGTDDLAALRDVIMDGDLREQVNLSAQGKLDKGSISVTILERLDPSQEHLTFRRFIRALGDELTTRSPSLESMGPWRRAAAAAALMAYEKHRQCFPHVLEAAWELMRGSAGLDTDVLGVHQVPTGSGRSSDMTLELAIRILHENRDAVPGDWKQDPIWRATMKLVEAGRAYDGYAHVEAARDLDEAGHPLRAMDALQSAAFWSTTHHAQPLAPVFEAVHSLAASQGWGDLVEYMSHLAQRHNELIK